MQAMHQLALSIKPSSGLYASYEGIEKSLKGLEDADGYLAVVGDVFSLVGTFLPSDQDQIIGML